VEPFGGDLGCINFERPDPTSNQLGSSLLAFVTSVARRLRRDGKTTEATLLASRVDGGVE